MPPIQDTIETTAAVLQIVSTVCSVLRSILPTKKPLKVALDKTVVDSTPPTQPERARS